MKVTKELIIKKFNEYNNSFFNNELKLSFEVKVSRTTKSFGHVKFTRIFGEIRLLAISSKAQFTEESFAETLIHEMVHIWESQVLGKIPSHDYQFIKKAKEISEISGYDISVTADIPVNVSRKCFYIIAQISDNRYKVKFLSKSKLNLADRIMEFSFKGMSPSINSEYVLKSSKYTVSRNGRSFYMLNQEEVAELGLVA
jgi:hypothetical protein